MSDRSADTVYCFGCHTRIPATNVVRALKHHDCIVDEDHGESYWTGPDLTPDTEFLEAVQ